MGRLKWLQILFVVCLLLPGWAACQELPSQYTLNLNKRLVYYDKGTQSYLPLSANNVQGNTAATLPLGLNNYKGMSLEVCLEQGSTLFFNGSLMHYYQADRCQYMPVDSLIDVYGADTLLLNIYHPALNLKNIAISISLLNANNDEHTSYLVVRRNQDLYKNFAELVLLFLFGLVTLTIVVSGKSVFEFYDFVRGFSLRILEEKKSVVRVFSRTNLVYLFVQSLIVAFVILLISIYSASEAQISYLHTYTSNYSIYLIWVLVGLGYMALFIVRYVLVSLNTLLFNIKDVRDIHFRDFTRMSMFFSLIIAVVLSVTVIIDESVANIVVYGVVRVLILFFLLRTFILYQKILRSSSYRKLHLFSYLCVTEILPLIISLKIII